MPKDETNGNGAVRITARDIFERIVAIETRLADLTANFNLQGATRDQKIETISKQMEELIEETKKSHERFDKRLQKLEDLTIQYNPHEYVPKYDKWGKEWEESKARKAVWTSLIILGSAVLGASMKAVFNLIISGKMFPL